MQMHMTQKDGDSQCRCKLTVPLIGVRARKNGKDEAQCVRCFLFGFNLTTTVLGPKQKHKMLTRFATHFHAGLEAC